jgi:hypothetical protein
MVEENQLSEESLEATTSTPADSEAASSASREEEKQDASPDAAQ